MSAGNAQAVRPWGQREQGRLAFRISLFEKRGVEPGYAAELADRLYERDLARDELRLCLECNQLRRSGRCKAAMDGRMTDQARQFAPIQDLLQRCPHFAWATPQQTEAR